MRTQFMVQWLSVLIFTISPLCAMDAEEDIVREGVSVYHIPACITDMYKKYSNRSKTYQITVSQLLKQMNNPLPRSFTQYEPPVDAPIFGGSKDRSYYRVSNDGENRQMIVVSQDMDSPPEDEELYMERHQAKVKLLELLPSNLQLYFSWAEDAWMEAGFVSCIYFNNYPETKDLTKESPYLHYTFLIG